MRSKTWQFVFVYFNLQNLIKSLIIIIRSIIEYTLQNPLWVTSVIIRFLVLLQTQKFF